MNNKIQKCYVCNHDVNTDYEFISILSVLNSRDNKKDKFKKTKKEIYICNKCWFNILCLQNINKQFNEHLNKIDKNTYNIRLLNHKIIDLKLIKIPKIKIRTKKIIIYYLTLSILFGYFGYLIGQGL